MALLTLDADEAARHSLLVANCVRIYFLVLHSRSIHALPVAYITNALPLKHTMLQCCSETVAAPRPQLPSPPPAASLQQLHSLLLLPATHRPRTLRQRSWQTPTASTRQDRLLHQVCIA